MFVGFERTTVSATDNTASEWWMWTRIVLLTVHAILGQRTKDLDLCRRQNIRPTRSVLHFRRRRDRTVCRRQLLETRKHYSSSGDSGRGQTVSAMSKHTIVQRHVQRMRGPSVRAVVRHTTTCHFFTLLVQGSEEVLRRSESPPDFEPPDGINRTFIIFWGGNFRKKPSRSCSIRVVLVTNRREFSEICFGTALMSVGQRSALGDGLVAMPMHYYAKRFTSIAQTQTPAIEDKATTVLRQKQRWISIPVRRTQMPPLSMHTKFFAVSIRIYISSPLYRCWRIHRET